MKMREVGRVDWSNTRPPDANSKKVSRFETFI
jgi:hypothetical protein